MKKRTLLLSAIAIVATVAILFSACRKINDYTELGGDLLPPIDNVNTFDTSLTVELYNDTFTLALDSEVTTRSDEHFLGQINSDPFFGKTDARLFLELKNPYYGTYPFARKDSIILDSVVMVLNSVEVYGDTMVPQIFKVYEITGTAFDEDSNYLIRKENFTYNTFAPLNQFPITPTIPASLNDSVRVFLDTTSHQLRIKLDTNFARRLINYDTTDGYKNDSIFRTRFKGFAIRSEGLGEALVGINLNSINTKLAFYYSAPKKAGGGRDTVVSYFYFTPDCGEANYVKRDYGSSPVALAAGSPLPATIGYIQKTPGTFANVKIPALAGLSNRIVHRAELIVEQIYHPSDDIFPPPDRLYLDAADPTISAFYKFRTIPYSQDISTISGFDFVNFGVNPLNAKDPGGTTIKQWKFNLSRYVQHIVNGTQTSYDLRLYAPLTLKGRARIVGTTVETDVYPSTYVNGAMAIGRIRVGGGNHPTQKMRLRIVFSKL